MLRPGLVSITFRLSEPEQIIQLCSDAQLGGIEWGGDVHVPHGDTRRAAAVGEMTRAAGLTSVAYGSYYAFRDLYGREEVDSQLLFDTAEALEAPVVRVWAGTQGSDETDEATRMKLVASARRLGNEAERRGLRVAFEYHANTLTDTPKSATRLMNDIDHPAVTVLWQPPNGASKEHSTQSLRLALPRLEHIHCFHWGPRGFDDKLPLEGGEERWLNYLSIIASVTPKQVDRWILLEFLPNGKRNELVRDAKVLRRWIQVVGASDLLEN